MIFLTLNPFLNSTKNGDVNSTYERGSDVTFYHQSSEKLAIQECTMLTFSFTNNLKRYSLLHKLKYLVTCSLVKVKGKFPVSVKSHGKKGSKHFSFRPSKIFKHMKHVSKYLGKMCINLLEILYCWLQRKHNMKKKTQNE